MESLQHSQEATGSGFHLCDCKPSKPQFPFLAHGMTGIKCTDSAKGTQMAGGRYRHYPGATLAPPWRHASLGCLAPWNPQALCFLPLKQASVTGSQNTNQPEQTQQQATVPLFNRTALPPLRDPKHFLAADTKPRVPLHQLLVPSVSRPGRSPLGSPSQEPRPILNRPPGLREREVGEGEPGGQEEGEGQGLGLQALEALVESPSVPAWPL